MDSNITQIEWPHASPAGESYRNHVIVVTPQMNGEGQWQSTSSISNAAVEMPLLEFGVAGPFPSRMAAYEASIRQAQRYIDRWHAEIGL